MRVLFLQYLVNWKPIVHITLINPKLFPLIWMSCISNWYPLDWSRFPRVSGSLMASSSQFGPFPYFQVGGIYSSWGSPPLPVISTSILGRVIGRVSLFSWVLKPQFLTIGPSWIWGPPILLGKIPPFSFFDFSFLTFFQG